MKNEKIKVGETTYYIANDSCSLVIFDSGTVQCCCYHWLKYY